MTFKCYAKAEHLHADPNVLNGDGGLTSLEPLSERFKTLCVDGRGVAGGNAESKGRTD